MKEISEQEFINAYKEVLEKFPIVLNETSKMLPSDKLVQYIIILRESISKIEKYFGDWKNKKNLGLNIKYFSDLSGRLPYYIII